MRELLDMYAERAVEMRRARISGDLAEADLMLRQMVMFEVGIRIGGKAGGEFSAKLFEALRDGLPAELPPPAVYPPTPQSRAAEAELPGCALLGHLFATARAYAKASVHPPLPDPDFWWPGHLTVHVQAGATMETRAGAREMARMQFAETLAMYEATETDESWARYEASLPAHSLP